MEVQFREEQSIDALGRFVLDENTEHLSQITRIQGRVQ
jgi:hypothetical protein